jgi:hypothetical protein
MDSLWKQYFQPFFRLSSTIFSLCRHNFTSEPEECNTAQIKFAHVLLVQARHLQGFKGGVSKSWTNDVHARAHTARTAAASKSLGSKNASQPHAEIIPCGGSSQRDQEDDASGDGQVRNSTSARARDILACGQRELCTNSSATVKWREGPLSGRRRKLLRDAVAAIAKVCHLQRVVEKQCNTLMHSYISVSWVKRDQK